MPKYDFGGYATKVGLRCSDGRTILKDAFKDNDGQRVPLVWQHQRDNPDNVLGHAMLENRPDGVYAYCAFNDTDKGQRAKTLVQHGDIVSLSIYANHLVENSRRDVQHGMIREVSLVIAGANPGAMIDNIYVEHSNGSMSDTSEEAIIYADQELSISDPVEHADQNEEPEETVSDVLETLNEKQRKAVAALLSVAMEHTESEEPIEDPESEDSTDEPEEGEDDEDDDPVEHSDEGSNSTMKHVFENQNGAETHELSHDEMTAIFADAKKYGSLKDAVLEHGITDIDILFPEAKVVTPTPDMVMRNQDWVNKVWSGTRKSPFSRIKSVAADLTKNEARARGYIKGKEKVEEQFGLLRRITTPQTVYKKQALDRDDVIDITDFDVVAWLKAEMRMMLNEELARAVLVGDGRLVGDNDKILEDHIRPIWTDADTYTIKYNTGIAVTDDDNTVADKFVRAANKARKNYMGSGAPTLFTDSETLTDLLLATDKIGRKLYPTMAELASALRVSEIVEVPLMEGLTRTVTVGNTAKTMQLQGIIVNLKDYTVGADKGGAVSMFDDFDIDYNKMKYLIETRCSGALTHPFSAIVLETAGPPVEEEEPEEEPEEDPKG